MAAWLALCYFVMLTALSEEVDKLIGLTVGADDYPTKPFSPPSYWPGSTRCCAVPAMPPRLGSPRRKGPRMFGALSTAVAAREVHLDGGRRWR